MTCKVCHGSGRMTYPHPDDEGGMTTATGPCPECIEYQVCPQCDRDMMMEYGALLICVHCGFTYDEAETVETALQIRLQQQFAVYRSEYAILLAGAKECEARATAAERRIHELEAQLAAQAWRPVTTVPPGVDVELLVHGYIGEDEYWYYRDETEPIQAWRPLPAPPIN